MNLQKKFIIFVIGVVLFTTAGFWLFQSYITKIVSDPDKIGSLLENLGVDNPKIGEQPGNWQSGAFTGIPVLSKPIEMGDMATIMEIKDHQVWLSARYYDRKFTNPELYIIGDKQLKFTADNFITLNPEILL